MEPPDIHDINNAGTPSTNATVDDPEQNCYFALMKKFEDWHGDQDKNDKMVQTRTIFIHNGEHTIKPKLVSIGPFFHGDPDLRDMERRKDKLMFELLPRRQQAYRLLPELILEVKTLREEAQKFYSGNIQLKDFEFAQMLLFDSCFIIHLLLYIVSKGTHWSLTFANLDVEAIRSDLLLTGNQIPLFAVRNVYKAIQGLHEEGVLPRDFNDIVAAFACGDKSSEVRPDFYNSANHLLDLFWLSFMHDQAEIAPMAMVAARILPSATELNLVAGIIFKNQSLSSMARFQDGIFEISPFSVDETMKSIVTNLVIYERNFALRRRKVSSYMMLMNCLIKTERDLALLQECGIIVNSQGTNSNTTAFFNEVGKMCIIDYNNHLFTNLFADVDKHFYSKRKRLFGILRRDYCYSPWARISVAAAVFLLILTIIQTILGGIQTQYTIHPHK